MRIYKPVLLFALLVPLSFSWTPSKVGAEEYTTQDEQNKKVLKQGLMGAGVGAIAAGTSGGSAGKGALIGAGTNVIGSALIDTLTTPSQPQPQVTYVQQQVPEVRPAVSVDAPRTGGGCGRRN